LWTTVQFTPRIERARKHTALDFLSAEMSEKNFTCNPGTHEMSCGPPGCICIQLGPDPNETDCRCIKDIYKTTPDNSREVSEIDEFIDKAKQNVNTAIFTINMTEKPLSEVAELLEMFVPEVKVPESIKNKIVSLSVDMQTMKEIIHDLGLEMGQNK
jgi:hypothetical protein